MSVDQDLIWRLNREAKMLRGIGMAGKDGSRSLMCEEAASRLQSLKQENAKLREALKPFVDAYDFYAPEEQDNKPDEDHAYASEFNMGDLRRAHAATETKGND